MVQTENALTEEKAGSSREGFTLGSLPQAFRRQGLRMIITSGVVFILVLIWVFATPKRYTSEMVLLVQNARNNGILTPGEVGPTLSDATNEELNSEIAVLNSQDLLDQVVDSSWVAANANSIPRNVLLAHERAVNQLRRSLNITAIRDSHAFSVKYTGPSPKVVQSTLNRLLDLFLKTQRDLARLPGATRAFEDRVSKYQSDLNQARRELMDFQDQHGFVSAELEQSSLEQKLLDLDTKRRDTDAQIDELHDRVHTTQEELKSTPPRSPTSERAATSTGAIDQLSVLLVSLQNKRTGLLTQFKPTDRLVVEADEQIKETERALSQARSPSPTESTTDANPIWIALRRDLDATHTDLNGVTARKKSLAKEISSIQQDLKKTELQAGTFELLKQNVANAESEYHIFEQKREVELTGDFMDQSHWSNVAVIQYPTMPVTPTHPQPRSDLALGLFTAIFIGLCTGYYFETMRGSSSLTSPV
jgi:uncharacterized protein involved in exopolysaccharide biosynthesis